MSTSSAETRPIPAGAILRRIAFVSTAPVGSANFGFFPHPAPTWAVAVAETKPSAFEVLTVSASPKDNPTARGELFAWVAESAPVESPPISVVVHGGQVVWTPGQASIMASPERIEALLRALVEFVHYEGELRKIEGEIESAWPELEADTPLAYDVTPAALERSDEIGQRMDATLKRRIRFARIETPLYHSTPMLGAAGVELGDRLREKARLESRLESCDGHLEVFEYVYEMSSQRIGETQAARKERTLEWLIIVLLAIEVLVMILELLWRLEA